MTTRRNHKKVKDVNNTVKVKQKARASTGQGGNAFAINASDVGVVRTDINPKK